MVLLMGYVFSQKLWLYVPSVAGVFLFLSSRVMLIQNWMMLEWTISLIYQDELSYYLAHGEPSPEFKLSNINRIYQDYPEKINLLYQNVCIVAPMMGVFISFVSYIYGLDLMSIMLFTSLFLFVFLSVLFYYFFKHYTVRRGISDKMNEYYGKYLHGVQS